MRASLIYGILFVGVIVLVSFYLEGLLFARRIPISALLIGVIMGALLSPLFRRKKDYLEAGINFSAKKLLRFGIVLYGFNVTLDQISGIGWSGFLIALCVVVGIFALGSYVGVKFLKLDKDVAMLVSGGSAICGAAAVLALESSIKSEPYKGIIAVGTVVFFGLLSMFLYPLFYVFFLHDSFSQTQMGVYIGATLHEVANVVGAAGSIGLDASVAAITVKMIRVILLVPLLLIIPYLTAKNPKEGVRRQFPIPWFAFLFLLMVVINSFIDPLIGPFLSQDLIEKSTYILRLLCSISLVFAMSALGLQIDLKKFLSSGGRAFLLGAILFGTLLVLGFLLVKIFA
ncbi:Putative membrane protein YeiH [Helicobacter mustelae]|uniref:YeiH family protein n=1 Tax=Helicobacter mustelae TaxID=217 RepID=UPI000DFE3995|nr:putative sulfate exporter family transporter [Helicobacter mustelae]STP13305.1 Putative membrane protein YeiH [Helicobacter mustelae]